MVNVIRLASELTFDSVVDGPGMRTVIWTQGCPHGCKGCHNPGTHDVLGGKLYDIQAVIKDVLSANRNVTFSGGDPFLQPLECAIIAEAVNDAGFKSWAYSGWTFEQLLGMAENNKDIMRFLKALDRLVDGPYIESKRTLSVPYRGSTNQRIINVPDSLLNGTIVIDFEVGKELKTQKPSGIFI